MRIKFENEVYDLESRHERYLLHQATYEYTEELEWTDELEEELEEINKLISNQDYANLINRYFFESDIIFLEIEEDGLLEEALVSAGYKVESSNVSRSLYVINDDGEEVRISDHKRPAVEQNGIYTEHEYDKELIVKDNIVFGRQLRRNGFSKLDKDEYLLG